MKIYLLRFKKTSVNLSIDEACDAVLDKNECIVPLGKLYFVETVQIDSLFHISFKIKLIRNLSQILSGTF